MFEGVGFWGRLLNKCIPLAGGCKGDGNESPLHENLRVSATFIGGVLGCSGWWGPWGKARRLLMDRRLRCAVRKDGFALVRGRAAAHPYPGVRGRAAARPYPGVRHSFAFLVDAVFLGSM